MDSFGIIFVDTNVLEIKEENDLEDEVRNNENFKIDTICDLPGIGAKCGEIYATNENNLILMCGFCNELHENLLEFGHHLQKKHLNSTGGVRNDHAEAENSADFIELNTKLQQSDVADSNHPVQDTQDNIINEDSSNFPSMDSDYVDSPKFTNSREDPLESKPYCQKCDRYYKTKHSYSHHNYMYHGKGAMKKDEMPMKSVQQCDESKTNFVFTESEGKRLAQETQKTLADSNGVQSSDTSVTKLNDERNSNPQIPLNLKPVPYCKICDRYYKNKHSYRHHKYMYHGKGATENSGLQSTKSTDTGSIDGSISSAKNAMKIPPDAMPYCKKCDRFYKNNLSYNYHNYKKHGEGAIRKDGISTTEIAEECEESKTEFISKESDGKQIQETQKTLADSTESLLKQDINSSQQNEPAQSPIDNQSSDSSDNKWNDESNRKQKKPTNSKSYCNKCDRYYKNTQSYRYHKYMYHGKGAEKKPLQPPQPIDLKCKYCDKECADEIEAKQHREAVHRGRKPYTCPHCPITFKNGAERQVHLNRHLGIRPYKCEQCPSAFYTNTVLRAHMLTHNVGGTLECKICGRKFIHESVRTAHMRTHNTERPFQCELCGVSYKRQSRLTDHKKRHTNFRTHECNICGKKFFNNLSLKNHAIGHTNNRSLACTVCGKTFARRHSLKQHKRLHASVKKFSCNICGKAFAQYAGLYGHRKTHGDRLGGKDLSKSESVEGN